MSIPNVYFLSTTDANSRTSAHRVGLAVDACLALSN